MAMMQTFSSLVTHSCS